MIHRQLCSLAAVAMTLVFTSPVFAQSEETVVPKNLTIDGVSAVAALVITAFAVDRFATAFMSMLSLLPSFRELFPSPGETPIEVGGPGDQSAQLLIRRNGERRHRAFYFLFAAVGAAIVVFIGKIGILDVLGFKQAEAHPYFDFGLTALILTAGADRVAALLQLSGASVSGQDEGKPIEITGSLTINGKNEDFVAKIDTAQESSE